MQIFRARHPNSVIENLKNSTAKKYNHLPSYIILCLMRYTLLGVELSMMTSSNGNIFRVTGHLCGEFTGDRWIPRTKASDAGLWCFLWFAPE